jgi:hypothetical protein
VCLTNLGRSDMSLGPPGKLSGRTPPPEPAAGPHPPVAKSAHTEVDTPLADVAWGPLSGTHSPGTTLPLHHQS